MKQRLIKLLVWFLSLLESEVEKAVREKGLPKVIYCHPSVFADCKKVESKFPIGEIRIIENDLMERGKFIFSWDEPIDFNKPFFDWPLSGFPVKNNINSVFNA